VLAPAGAPNILIVMTDDVGFGASSTFGGPIPTPHLDRLAARGLRYTRFHTTGVCSPTRASLLTGRNHHAVGAGELVDAPTGYPGYSGSIPRSAATIGKILGENGYSTAFFGKHHNIPPMQLTGTGPFSLWPTGLGFDYFFGFLGGEVHQWQPRLYRGTSLVESMGDGQELLDKQLVDDTLSWLYRQQAATPDRPFLIYFATGTGHSPHHAPAAYIEKYKGRFDKGWDALREQTFEQQKKLGIIPMDTRLTERPSPIPSWKSLSEEMKKVNARYMEVYAASIDYFDDQFGRLLDEMERIQLINNTLIFFVQGDNGATAQSGPWPAENGLGAISNKVRQSEQEFIERLQLTGGPETYQVASTGWSYAMNTPFPWFKHQASHLGATRNGMVVSWPRKIESHGQTRQTFSHVIDILPTVLDAIGIPAPVEVDGISQQRIDGISLLPSFSDTNASGHSTQYFEIGGERAIYHDGWLASTTPKRMPWERDPSKAALPQWAELYDLRNDFSQSINLADKFPGKLKELAAIWESQATQNSVYPLDHRPHAAREHSRGFRPNEGRTAFTYWSSGISVPQAAAPSLGRQSFTLTAELEINVNNETAVILANGSKLGGWAFYLDDGRPTVIQAFSHLPQDKFVVSSSKALKPGKAKVSFIYDKAPGRYAGGELSICVNGRAAGSGKMEKTLLGIVGMGETLDIGRDTGVPVSDEYPAGMSSIDISKVQIELAPVSTGCSH
jgi:arylsulfatase